MDWTLKLGDLAIVVATFTGPIAALAIQRRIDESKDQHRRRLGVYRALMTERAVVSPAFVAALNAVPIEFAETRGPIGTVRAAHKQYLHHLSKNAQDPAWDSTRITLLVDLLLKMGSALGYEFDRVDIENGIYAPVAHAKVASDQDAIREGVAALLRGEKALPMEVKSLATNPEMVELWKGVLTKLDGWLERNSNAAPLPRRDDGGGDAPEESVPWEEPGY